MSKEIAIILFGIFLCVIGYIIHLDRIPKERSVVITVEPMRAPARHTTCINHVLYYIDPIDDTYVAVRHSNGEIKMCK